MAYTSGAFWCRRQESFFIALALYWNTLRLAVDLLAIIINNLGWTMMVTGQSVVLYSRLHLVLNDLRLLRAILWMIIIDAFLFHIPTTVTHFGAYYSQQSFYDASQVIEKIQMTGFCI